MIGEYVNTGTGRRVAISPAVPGAQYRITAWALIANYNGRRSARPAMEYATTREARECGRHKSLSLILQSFLVYMIVTMHSCKGNK